MMDSIKRLTTDALQEVEDRNGYAAITALVAAVEELASIVEDAMYPATIDGYAAGAEGLDPDQWPVDAYV